MNRHRRGEEPRRVDAVGLALVRGRAEILECDGRPDERILVLRRLAEVEERPGDGGRPRAWRSAVTCARSTAPSTLVVSFAAGVRSALRRSASV